MRGMPTFLRQVPGAGRIFRALGISGVPTVGYFGADWPIGTMLILYWVETVLITLSVVVLAWRHQRLTKPPGRRDRSFRREFLGVMVPFTLGHGVFVAVYAFMGFPQLFGPEARVDARSLGVATLSLSVFLLAALLVDLQGLTRRSFVWVQGHGHRAQGRMIVTHLTIIFGGIALGTLKSSFAFLAVFVGLKALMDLAAILSERRDEDEVSATAG